MPGPEPTPSVVDPAARRPDAFLSYSRRDSELAARLTGLLEERGKDVWVDTQEIPAATRWRDELARAIEVSDAVLALVTPDWIASENCRHEVRHADEAGKRIIPVLAVPPERMPEMLASRQWVELAADEAAAVDAIVAAIERDLPYVRAHARYLEESQRWDAAGRERGHLLRGGELAAAEAWLATRSEDRDPRPTPEQIAFIQTSRADATRRLRLLTAVACAAALVVVALGVVAWVQRGIAVDREQASRSRELAALSEVRRATDPETAVRLAVRGLEARDTEAAQLALRRAIAASPVVARVGRPGDEVADAVLAGDGRMLVTARDDGLVRGLDPATGAVRWSWQGAPGLVNLEPSADGAEVAVAQPDGVVRTLAIADGSRRAEHRLAPAADSVAAVEGPGGRAIAAVAISGQSSIATLRDRATGRTIADLTAGDLPGRPVFSREGAVVAVPYRSGTVRVFDAANGALRAGARWHATAVNRVAVHPGGRLVATMADDGSVMVGDPSSAAEPRRLRPPAGESVQIASVRFSPSGAFVAAAGNEGIVRVWELAGDGELALTGHVSGVTSLTFLDEGTLVSGGRDGTVRVWDLSRGRERAVLRGHALGVLVSPGSTAERLVTVGDEGVARIWSVPGAFTVVGAPGAADTVAIGGDGALLATVSALRDPSALWTLSREGVPRRLAEDRLALDVDVAADGSRAALGGIGLRLAARDGAPREVAGAAGPFRDVVVAGDGSRLAGRVGDRIEVRSGLDGALVSELPLPERTIFPMLAISADGDAVAVSDIGAPITVYDAASGEVVGSAPAPESSSLPPFAIDPSGERVFRVAYGFPREPVIVDVATGRRTTLSGAASGALDMAAFSADGALLLTAGGGAAQVWDAHTGGLLTELGRDRSRTTTAAFAPDARLVVTGHADGLVRAWDRETGALLGEFDGGATPILQVATALGGERVLAVARDEGTLRMFTCDACASASRLRDLAAGHVAFGRLD